MTEGWSGVLGRPIPTPVPFSRIVDFMNKVTRSATFDTKKSGKYPIWKSMSCFLQIKYMDKFSLVSLFKQIFTIYDSITSVSVVHIFTDALNFCGRPWVILSIAHSHGQHMSACAYVDSTI